jgi:hypothetical protein
MMADGTSVIERTEMKAAASGIALLREPFPPNQISKLPKPTAAQTNEVKADFKKGIRCDICGGWHHPKVVHLDYVGHAALTDRLLDADPEWNWEPVDLPGLPNAGTGMWIKLTVCGVSRLGYGSADGKSGGDAIKEIIGDALRNAAMRFGAALDLWHKGDLHAEPDAADEAPAETRPTEQKSSKAASRGLYTALMNGLSNQQSADALRNWGKSNASEIKSLPKDWADEIRAEYAKELEAFVALESSEKEQNYAEQ